MRTKASADYSPRYLVYHAEPISAADGLLELQEGALLPFLDKRTGWETLRVYSEITDATGTYASNVVQFSRFEGSGYVGKLTEIFNLAYVYGSSLLRVDGKSGADAKYGADCSNFIIYGRRREGFRVPYVNPKNLLPYLSRANR